MLRGAAIGWLLGFVVVVMAAAASSLPWGEHGTRTWAASTGRKIPVEFVLLLSRDGTNELVSVLDVKRAGGEMRGDVLVLPDDYQAPAFVKMGRTAVVRAWHDVGGVQVEVVESGEAPGAKIARVELSVADTSMSRLTYVSTFTPEGIRPESSWASYDPLVHAVFAGQVIIVGAGVAIIPAAIGALLGRRSARSHPA